MVDVIIAAVAGFIIGGFFGVFLMALCVLSGRDSREEEKRNGK